MEVREEAMKGRVLDYSVQANEGVISGDDGERYTFQGADWKGQEVPKAGMVVDFVARGRRAEAIYPAAALSSSASGPKSRLVASLLAILLGGFGLHKFYLGYKKEGVIHILATIPGMLLIVPPIIIAIVSLVEGVIYLSMSDEDFYRTHVEGEKPWF